MTSHHTERTHRWLTICQTTLTCAFLWARVYIQMTHSDHWINLLLCILIIGVSYQPIGRRNSLAVSHHQNLLSTQVFFLVLVPIIQIYFIKVFKSLQITGNSLPRNSAVTWLHQPSISWLHDSYISTLIYLHQSLAYLNHLNLISDLLCTELNEIQEFLIPKDMTLGSYRLSRYTRWLSEAKGFLDTSRNLALRSPGYTRRFSTSKPR